MGCITSKCLHERHNTYGDYDRETIIRSVSIHPQLVTRRRAQIYDMYMLDSQELGSGVTGSVRCGTSKVTKQKYAIKMIRTKHMSEENKQLLKNEINILQQLDHPNIVKLYETYESADELYLVMELCTGGELYNRLMEQHNCHFNEEEIRVIMRKLFSAVCYLHEKHIAHRDLKLSNIMYKNKTSDEIKLIDFGLSKVYMHDAHIKSMNTIVGTPYYIAPEVIQENKEGYGKTCDIWSLGVIMYMLATGKPPIYGENPSEIMGNIGTQEIMYNRGDFKHYSKNMLVFLKHLLEKNPDERYTAPEALDSPWLSRTDTEVHIPSIYIQSIKQYAYKYTRLKRGILLVLAYNCEANSIYKIRDIFLELDKDGRGRISKEVFINALLDNDPDLQPEDAEEIFSYIDEDDSEYVNYTEFIAACMPFEYINKDFYIQKVFHILDTDNTNYISFYNLREYFKSNTIEELFGLLKEANIFTATNPLPILPSTRDEKEGKRQGIDMESMMTDEEEDINNNDTDNNNQGNNNNPYKDLKIEYEQFKQIMMAVNKDLSSTSLNTPSPDGHSTKQMNSHIKKTSSTSSTSNRVNNNNIIVEHSRTSSTSNIDVYKDSSFSRNEPTRDLHGGNSMTKHVSQNVTPVMNQNNKDTIINPNSMEMRKKKIHEEKDIIIMKIGEIVPLDID
ncbi:hypothetical protein WA158_002813 [Blastocystis sp. Blastoise]